jgi:hypothetical protein
MTKRKLIEIIERNCVEWFDKQNLTEEIDSNGVYHFKGTLIEDKKLFEIIADDIIDALNRDREDKLCCTPLARE